MDIQDGLLREVEFPCVPLDLQAMRDTYPDHFPHKSLWLASWD